MSETSPRSLDELFDALAARQRRWLLRLLGERDEPATISELARDLCSADGAVDGGPEQGELEVHVLLHHVHAPKLAAAGLVEFDHERGVLEPTSRIDRVGPILDWAADSHRGGA